MAPRRKAPPAPKPVQKWIDPIAHLSAKERRKLPVNITSGLRFMVPAPEPVKEKKPAPKNDPTLIAFVREMRDRWLELVERDPALILPAGKYDVVRALPEAPAPLPRGRSSLPAFIEARALPAAA